MKRKYTYILLLIFFLGATAFVISNYSSKKKQKEVSVYTLQPRKGLLAKSPEWLATKNEAYRLNNLLSQNPGDTKSELTLATLFMQEARVTGNYMYYDAAALRSIKSVLKKEPDNIEALVLQSHIYLSQHHFTEGLEVAEKARKLNPYYAFIYGLLVDGNVEMGDYKAAVEKSDEMVSIRPDIRSYSRISYLREIHGDMPGAIEAMKMAVDAGGNGDEPTEWARTQLARLYEHTGDLKSAEMHYTIALNNRTAYAPAIAGLGNLAIAAADYNKAIKLYEEAAELLPDFSIHKQLAQLYYLTGNEQKAKSVTKRLIEELQGDAKKGEEDEEVGHYTDRELAYAYLLNNDNDNALKHALIEYNRRPENIDVNETVGWVYHKQGKNAEALPYIKTALKTNSKNPALLCQAGLIYISAGNVTEGKALLNEGLKNNPNIDFTIKQESLDALKKL